MTWWVFVGFLVALEVVVLIVGYVQAQRRIKKFDERMKSDAVAYAMERDTTCVYSPECPMCRYGGAHVH